MTTTLNTVVRNAIVSFVARLVLLLTLMVGLLSAASAQTVTFFHNDLAGTPMLATNAAGAVVWKENYLPFGHRQVADSASSGNKLWFTGKAYDRDTQLSYMGARYYMPLLGRFTGVDPMEIVPEQPHSFNRYAYANNNPYKYVDPDGQFPIPLLVKASAATIFLVAGANAAMTPEQRAQMARQLAQQSQRLSDALGRASNWVFNEGTDKPVDIVVPGDKYPESAEHIRDAQSNGQPEVLTIDRGGAKDRRRDAMNGQPVVPGQDRDEYPPALTAEGGRGASVRPVSPSDNRGAGACVGAQCRGLPDGTRIRIIPR